MSAEHLVFGQIPPGEEAYRRRPTNKKPPDGVGLYSLSRFAKVLEEALKQEEKKWQQGEKQNLEQQREILEAIWGKGVEIPQYISPSTASMCLRWVGYEALNLYPPTPAGPEQRLTMMIGSAAHFSILRMLEKAIRGRQETTFTVEEDNLSGRVDYFFRNPATGHYQIVEFKTVGRFAFKQITREKLPSYLRSERENYCPQPEHYNQVLLYMWAKRKQGLEVDCANIIYVNRDNGEIKEALVVWNDVTKYDASQLVEKIQEAKACIEKGQLPKPSVESPHICSGFCPYRTHCNYGSEFAAGLVRREQKRRPRAVYHMLRGQLNEQRRMMEEKGLFQPALPGFEGRPSPKRKPRARKKEKREEAETPIYLGQAKELKGEEYKCKTCGSQMVSIPVSVGKIGKDGMTVVNLVVGCLHCHPDRQGFKGKIQSVHRPRVVSGMKEERRKGVENA